MEEFGLGVGSGVRVRRRSAAERLRVVEETLEVGASVARVALRHGINANQIFQWQRLYREGKLGGAPSGNGQQPLRSTTSFLQADASTVL